MRLYKLLCGVALMWALPLSAAGAAPQVLALLPTEKPIEMACNATQCSVELSAYCLTKWRDPPTRGMTYLAPARSGLAVVVTAKDGTSKRIPVNAKMRFRTIAGEYAVRMSLPAAMVERFKGARFAVSVSRDVSLLPQPSDTDPDKLSAGEISSATGPLRRMARTVEEGIRKDDAATVRTLAHAINAAQRGQTLIAAKNDATPAGARYGRFCRTAADPLNCLRGFRDFHLWRIREAFRALDTGS